MSLFTSLIVLVYCAVTWLIFLGHVFFVEFIIHCMHTALGSDCECVYVFTFLCLCYFTTLSVAALCVTEWQGDKWVMYK